MCGRNLKGQDITVVFYNRECEGYKIREMLEICMHKLGAMAVSEFDKLATSS